MKPLYCPSSRDSLMLRNLMLLLCASVAAVGCSNYEETDINVKLLHSEPAMFLRHVVLFKFKDGTSTNDINRIETAFAALPSKIEAIHDFEWGTNISVENLSQGYTHCFLVTFKSAEDRAVYLPHPAHKEFGSLLRPHLDKVLVVDYWAAP